jgi:Arc/MetJ-type ribon-helix-helix transcriptional regulator
MKRTTVSLPDDLAAATEREARRRRTSVSEVVREALEARLGRKPGEKRELPFIGIGHSGYATTSEDVEEILRREWGGAGDR